MHLQALHQTAPTYYQARCQTITSNQALPVERLAPQPPQFSGWRGGVGLLLIILCLALSSGVAANKKDAGDKATSTPAPTAAKK